MTTTAGALHMLVSGTHQLRLGASLRLLFRGQPVAEQFVQQLFCFQKPFKGSHNVAECMLLALAGLEIALLTAQGIG